MKVIYTIKNNDMSTDALLMSLHMHSQTKTPGMLFHLTFFVGFFFFFKKNQTIQAQNKIAFPIVTAS